MSKFKTPQGRVVNSGVEVRRHVPDQNRPSQKKSINALKTKIRDTERLLKHADLPADVRVEKERALASYRQDADKIALDKVRSKMISKYHKVRFFERQKATRILKKLTRMLNPASPEDGSVENLRSAIANAQVDLNYTIYSPLAEKYHSLYAAEKDKEAPKQSSVASIDINEIVQCARHRPPQWATVKKCTDEGTLESLREGRLSSRHNHEDNDQKSTLAREPDYTRRSDHHKDRRIIPPQEHKKEEEEESDDAFFE